LLINKNNYTFHTEPMACAIRNTPEIHGIKLPDCEEQPVKEAKICMFADDTQAKNFDMKPFVFIQVFPF
jgi:hypothetical protein